MSSPGPRFAEPEAFADVLKRELETRLREFGPTRATFRRTEELAEIHIGDVSIRRKDRDFDVVVDFSLADRPSCRYRFVFPDVWRQALAEEHDLRSAHAIRSQPLTESISAVTAEGFVTILHALFDEELGAGDLGIPECDESRVTNIDYKW